MLYCPRWVGIAMMIKYVRTGGQTKASSCYSETSEIRVIIISPTSLKLLALKSQGVQ